LASSPYAIPGRDLTPISLASAPLEFTFVVAIYITCILLFLGAPLFSDCHEMALSAPSA